MVEDEFLGERSSHQLGGLGREEVGVVNCGSVHECVVEVLEGRGLVVRKTVPVSHLLLITDWKSFDDLSCMLL